LIDGLGDEEKWVDKKRNCNGVEISVESREGRFLRFGRDANLSLLDV